MMIVMMMTMIMMMMMTYISSQLKKPLNQHLRLTVHTLESKHHRVPGDYHDYHDDCDDHVCDYDYHDNYDVLSDDDDDDRIPVEVTNAEHCEDKNSRKAAVLLRNNYHHLSRC